MVPIEQTPRVLNLHRRVVTLNGETISRDGNLAVGEPQKEQKTGHEGLKKFGGDICVFVFFVFLFVSWGGRVRKENRKQIETKVPSEIAVLLGKLLRHFSIFDRCHLRNDHSRRPSRFHPSERTANRPSWRGQIWIPFMEIYDPRLFAMFLDPS